MYELASLASLTHQVDMDQHHANSGAPIKKPCNTNIWLLHLRLNEFYLVNYYYQDGVSDVSYNEQFACNNFFYPQIHLNYCFN